MSYVLKLAHPSAWLRYVVFHPFQIIIFIALITLLFVLKLPNLRFETSIYDLTIENLPETVQYQLFKQEFGSEEIILVVAKAGDVLSPKTFRQIDELAKVFSEVKGVKRVISLPGIKRSMEMGKPWTLSDFAKALAAVTLLEKNLISKDHRTTIVTLVLEDIEEKDRIIDAVNQVLKRQKTFLSVYQIGMPVVSKALASFTERDFLRLPPMTFLLIAIILFLLFRNVRGILIPAGSVTIALIWTFGLMALTGTPLSMLTMIVPIFLIAVGTAYCMYIFPEYLRSIKVSDSPREVSYRCFSQIGFPTSLAVFTTAIGLVSLLVNRITAIREFAIFSCFGMLSMLVIMMTFLPAVTALLPFPKRVLKKEVVKNKRLFDRFLSGIININLNHQKSALLIIGVITLAGLAGMGRIRVETNPVDFFKRETTVSRHFHDVYQDMAGSFPINVVIDSGKDDFFENPKALKDIEKLQHYMDSLEGIDKTISFVDYLKMVHYATNQYKEAFYALPEESFEIRMLVNNYKAMLGEDMLGRFINEPFSKLNILLRTHISSSHDFLETKRRIEAYLQHHFPGSFSFQVTGFGMVISQSSHLLTNGQVKSLSITLVLVFTIMFLLFMSFKVGIIGVVPNCFPIIVNFGIMGWMGAPLSVATSLIASIAIGLAVDDTIHYLVRYNREFKKDLDKQKALQQTIRRVGKPIIFTTLAISLGFSVLLASSFKPTAVFGLMMMITMFSALVADLILLPSLMLHVELVTLWDLLRLKLGKDPQKGIPLFDGLSRTQVHYILLAGNLRKYKAGAVLFKRGQVSDSMYALISGELDVVNIIETSSSTGIYGAKQLISTLKPGDVVGEMGMIRSCRRSATVIAAESVELLQINDRMIKRLQWLYPPTAQKFFFNLMTILCNRLEDLTECYLGVTALDTLTGLYTRPHLLEMLEKEMARSYRYQTPLSLLLMDLDHFKAVNQFYGHRAGDGILAELSKLIKKHSRKTDLICRYDGQLFAIMLPHISIEKAYAFGSRLKELIASQCFHFDDHPIYITASIGLVSLETAEGKSVEGLINQAMHALRLAKKRGRNRVETSI